MRLLPILVCAGAASTAHAQATGWVERNGSGTGGGVSDTPAIKSGPCDVAVDGQGRPVVVWLEAGSPSSIEVRRWDAGGWANLGQPVQNIGGSSPSPLLCLDTSGNPIVSWLQHGLLS